MISTFALQQARVCKSDASIMILHMAHGCDDSAMGIGNKWDKEILTSSRYSNLLTSLYELSTATNLNCTSQSAECSFDTVVVEGETFLLAAEHILQHMYLDKCSCRPTVEHH